MPGRKKWQSRLFIAGIVIALIWLGLTIYVQLPNGEYQETFGSENAPQHALILYDADPFYNFDQQISTAFAEGLAEQAWQATVSTIKSIREHEHADYDLYVFCANTYNWEPDWTMSHYLRTEIDLNNRAVVAITVGAGSTARAQRSLDYKIEKAGGLLVDSRTFWLARSNGENEQSKSNMEVARDQCRSWARSIAFQGFANLDL